MRGIKLLVDEQSTDDVIKKFVNQADIGRRIGQWNGIGGDDGHNIVLSDLREGHKGRYYWDARSYLLRNATLTDSSECVWKLFQNGSLYAYCKELMTDEDTSALFGTDQ